MNVLKITNITKKMLQKALIYEVTQTYATTCIKVKDKEGFKQLLRGIKRKLHLEDIFVIHLPLQCKSQP